MAQASKGHDFITGAAGWKTVTLVPSPKPSPTVETTGTGKLHAACKVTLGKAGWGSRPLPKLWAVRQEQRHQGHK